MISLTELKAATRAALKDVNALLPQLSSSAKKLSFGGFQNIIRNPHVRFVILREGRKIIGMGSFITMDTVFGLRARLEDVVVDERYRGKGLGERLMKKLIALARQKKVQVIELSSRPSRVAANKLYQKLGFKPHETNVYKLKL